MAIGMTGVKKQLKEELEITDPVYQELHLVTPWKIGQTRYDN